MAAIASPWPIWRGSYFPEFHAMSLRMIAARGGFFGWTTSSAAMVQVLPTAADVTPGTTLLRGAA